VGHLLLSSTPQQRLDRWLVLVGPQQQFRCSTSSRFACASYSTGNSTAWVLLPQKHSCSCVPVHLCTCGAMQSCSEHCCYCVCLLPSALQASAVSQCGLHMHVGVAASTTGKGWGNTCTESVHKFCVFACMLRVSAGHQAFMFAYPYFHWLLHAGSQQDCLAAVSCRQPLSSA
jgi:hypothetical protein